MDCTRKTSFSSGDPYSKLDGSRSATMTSTMFRTEITRHFLTNLPTYLTGNLNVVTDYALTVTGLF